MPRAFQSSLPRLKRQHLARSRSTPALFSDNQDGCKAPRAKRQRREIDPGDAVPPGVTVQEPAP